MVDLDKPSPQRFRIVAAAIARCLLGELAAQRNSYASANAAIW
jgi:hypothetical protein